jgi:hypothetical protein
MVSHKRICVEDLNNMKTWIAVEHRFDLIETSEAKELKAVCDSLMNLLILINLYDSVPTRFQQYQENQTLNEDAQHQEWIHKMFLPLASNRCTKLRV